MTSLKHVIREVHRRSLWQVVGIYLAGAWVSYQVVLGLTQGVGLPEWVPPLAIVLFLIGLPIVIATAFVQEGGPTREAFRGDDGARSDGSSVQPPPNAALAPASSGIAGFLTWPRALLGGVLAFALLGLGTSGYMAMRALGIGPPASLRAAGLIDDRERILVSEFRSTSGDTIMAAVVTEAFRVDLGRSTLIQVVAPADIREVLRRMDRTAVTRVDAELAREVALRDGIKVVVEGEVGTAAGAYVLTARLVAANGGEVLAAHRENARDSTEILGAIDRLSRRLRERTGESFRNVRSGPPLDQVITPSLEALRLFTESGRAQTYEGDPQKAVRLLQEAVAIDSGFASAHRGLAIFYSNQGRLDLAVQANDRALRDPQRLTDRERLLATAASHAYRRQPAQAIAAYETLLAREPDHRSALNNIALNYANLKDYRRAVQYLQKAIDADTTSFFSYANLGETYTDMGDVEKARSAYDAAIRRAPTSPWPVINRAHLPATQGDYRGAEAALRQLRDDSASTRQIVNRASNRLMYVVQTQGRLREAERILEETLRAAGNLDNFERRRTWNRLSLEIWLFDRLDRAALIAPRLLQLLPQFEPGDPALLDAAIDFALIDTQRARAFLEAYGTAEQRAQPWADSRVHLAAGAIALAEKDLPRAIAFMRRGTNPVCQACEELFIARAFEAAAEPDSVIAAYERFLATPSTERIYAEAFSLGTVYQRLGELHEQRGDFASARRYYGLLVDLWSGADPELQPRVQEATRALERLAAEPRR